MHATTNLGDISIRVPGNVTYDVNVQPGGLGSASVTVPRSSSSRHAIDATGDMGSILIAPASP